MISIAAFLPLFFFESKRLNAVCDYGIHDFVMRSREIATVNYTIFSFHTIVLTIVVKGCVCDF